MILGLDVWEGSLEIDEPILLDNGVKFLIPRLNSISGGLHLDDEFNRQWAEAKAFLRAPYFVYNPWVSGKANADWLLDNLPADKPPRVFCDIEVRMDGYSPTTYATEVNYFIGYLYQAKLRPCIYTGAWFLPYLSEWPNDIDYWWARYPYYLYPTTATNITWEEFNVRLEYTGWYPDPANWCPGPVKLWQCSADRYILPGTHRTMDVNAWNGTLAELETWWGARFPGVIPDDDIIPDTLLFEALVEGQNVRSSPVVSSTNIIGKLVSGQVLPALDIAGLDAWAEIAPNQWVAVKLGTKRYLRAISE